MEMRSIKSIKWVRRRQTTSSDDVCHFYAYVCTHIPSKSATVGGQILITIILIVVTN